MATRLCCFPSAGRLRGVSESPSEPRGKGSDGERCSRNEARDVRRRASSTDVAAGRDDFGVPARVREQAANPQPPHESGVYSGPAATPEPRWPAPPAGVLFEAARTTTVATGRNSTLWRGRRSAPEDAAMQVFLRVPGVGFEPTRPEGQRILSPPRLPFRHPGRRRAHSPGLRCSSVKSSGPLAR